jgi:hypothetical protein
MAYTDPTPRNPRGTGPGDRWPTYAGYALLAAVALAVIVALTSRDATTPTVKETPAEPPAQTQTAPPAATPTTPPAAAPETTPPATNP